MNSIEILNSECSFCCLHSNQVTRRSILTDKHHCRRAAGWQQLLRKRFQRQGQNHFGICQKSTTALLTAQPAWEKTGSCCQSLLSETRAKEPSQTKEAGDTNCSLLHNEKSLYNEEGLDSSGTSSTFYHNTWRSSNIKYFLMKKKKKATHIPNCKVKHSLGSALVAKHVTVHSG